MFQPGRVFPYLTTLCLGFEEESEPRTQSALDQADDLRRLVRCCPKLQHLDLAGAVADGVNMSPLLQLRQLGNLGVGCEGLDDRVIRDVIAKLTGLR